MRLKRLTKISLIIILLIIIGGVIYLETHQYSEISYTTLANTSIGTVEMGIAGNENASTCIALITGIHPRETLSIDPEIQAAKEFGNDNVKIINYKVTVTQNPMDYEEGRANGESLVHEYVNPSVTTSDADAVIISHSHNPDYGSGFYLATPEMDDASVEIARKIYATSDFENYPTTDNEAYNSTSSQLVSCPIAKAGYPTFVYEIPKNITAANSTDRAKELFSLMVRYTS